MRLGYAAVVTVVIAVTGCADAESEPASDGQVPPVPVVATPSVETEDGDASDLVLTVFEVCYSICLPTYAMPKFGVYGDDSLVVIDRADLQDPTSPFRARSFTLSADDAERMWELISEGGLTGGGAHAAGTREGVADGGGLVFETDIGGEITYVHAPFLDEPGGGVRGALYDLVTLFRAYAEESGTGLPLSWVMVGAAYPEPDAQPWPFDERPEGAPPCLPFNPDDVGSVGAELTSQEFYENLWASFDGESYAMQGRPLLPSETGCQDVQDRLDRIATNDATLNLGGAG